MNNEHLSLRLIMKDAILVTLLSVPVTVRHASLSIPLILIPPDLHRTAETKSITLVYNSRFRPSGQSSGNTRAFIHVIFLLDTVFVLMSASTVKIQIDKFYPHYEGCQKIFVATPSSTRWSCVAFTKLLSPKAAC